MGDLPSFAFLLAAFAGARQLPRMAAAIPHPHPRPQPPIKTMTGISIAIALMSSACNRPQEEAAANRTLLKYIQADADITAGVHMDTYETLSSDKSDEAATARLALLFLLDGYQKKKAALEQPPGIYRYTDSRAADVTAFLHAHAEERNQLEARLNNRKPIDGSEPVPRRRVINN